MSKPLNILLVEDEFMTRRLLKRKLTELGHTVIGDTDNTDDATTILEAENVDLAILDINLGAGNKDGIWLGEYIRFNKQIPFVYLTAYETTDIVDKAINTQPHAYLTKPFNELGLKTTLAIAGQQYDNKKPEEPIAHLIVKEDRFLKKVRLKDIVTIESDGNYLLLNTTNEQYRYRSTIKTVMDNLPSHTFLQTHRAYIVNKDHVINAKATGLMMVNNQEVPVSKGKRDEVLSVLKPL
ncbi:MAG: LytR/AlgR family response regulator transcription factor [Flavobacteriales bacterium]